MPNFETQSGMPPVFFDLAVVPRDQGLFDIALRIFRKDERVATSNIATVGWQDVAHVVSKCRVTLESRGYWQVEDHDFDSGAERLAA